ncbi:MAG: hypothetical protein HYX47_09365 [Burkholderiales bacterium]|nr:hypothetical protein [Burkholderiales bacterium]
MRIWLAMFAAPFLALACQSAMYALVTPACSAQSRLALHAVAAFSLLLAALFTLLAGKEWRRHAPDARPALDSDAADRPTSRRFLAMVAVAVGLLSCLAIAAMWIAVWVLSPCWQ